MKTFKCSISQSWRKGKTIPGSAPWSRGSQKLNGFIPDTYRILPWLLLFNLITHTEPLLSLLSSVFSTLCLNKISHVFFSQSLVLNLIKQMFRPTGQQTQQHPQPNSGSKCDSHLSSSVADLRFFTGSDTQGGLASCCLSLSLSFCFLKRESLEAPFKWENVGRSVQPNPEHTLWVPGELHVHVV